MEFVTLGQSCTSSKIIKVCLGSIVCPLTSIKFWRMRSTSFVVSKNCLYSSCSDTVTKSFYNGLAEIMKDNGYTTAMFGKWAGGYEGSHSTPDKRGIDCALLYDPKQFKVKRSLLVPSIPFEGDTVHLTRGFLIVTGKLARERVAVIVNHSPSRGAKSPVRVHAARQVKALKDSLLRTNPKLKLIVMGDLNDDPMDESLQTLGARKQMAEVQPGEFYNPWWQVLEDEKQGTLLYKGAWNLFDQILLSSTLLSEGKRLRYDHHAIFRAPYLFEQEGKYKGTILRTHAGRKWLNGYSDHLPTIVYLRRGK